MFKRIFQLFKIARKLSTSGADRYNKPNISNLPVSIKIFFIYSQLVQKEKF